MADQDPEAAEAKSKGVSVEELRKVKATQADLEKERLKQNQSGSDLLYAITGRAKSFYTYPRGDKGQ